MSSAQGTPSKSKAGGSLCNESDISDTEAFSINSYGKQTWKEANLSSHSVSSKANVTEIPDSCCDLLMGTMNSETSKCNKIRTTLLVKSVALEMSDLKAWEVHVSNLNPLVNTFVPQWIPSIQVDAIGIAVFNLNPDAESFLPHFDLNLCATVFSPKCKTNMENGVIGTLLFIIVILSLN